MTNSWRLLRRAGSASKGAPSSWGERLYFLCINCISPAHCEGKTELSILLSKGFLPQEELWEVLCANAP